MPSLHAGRRPRGLLHLRKVTPSFVPLRRLLNLFRNGREFIDFANIMRGAVEAGPPRIARYGYVAKQLVNVNMFIAQLGFCCVYFVFMADNLQDVSSYAKWTTLDDGLVLQQKPRAAHSEKRLDADPPHSHPCHLLDSSAEDPGSIRDDGQCRLSVRRGHGRVLLSDAHTAD